MKAGIDIGYDELLAIALQKPDFPLRVVGFVARKAVNGHCVNNIKNLKLGEADR